MINSVFIILFVFFSAHYFYFLFCILRGLNKLKTIPNKQFVQEFISILIPFRNESDNILASLNSITNQDYPYDKFEVIYANDNSGDDSLDKLCSAEKPSNIKVLSLNNSVSDIAQKKKAVSFGIENSHGEIIVTTDADCIHSPRWLKTLISQFDEQTALVSGPVDFSSSPDSNIWAELQRLEFQGLITAGAGLIGNNEPVICSAANLAYRKKIFYEVNGYEDALNLSSGDDELLMQKISRAGKYKIKFCVDKNAMVTTGCNKSVRQFFNQRKRWASKGLFYNDNRLIAKLFLIFLYYLSLPVLLILSFFSSLYLLLFVLVLMGKFILEFIIMNKGNKLIFQSNLLKYFLSAEIFQIPYIIISAISGATGNFTWKERKLKR